MVSTGREFPIPDWGEPKGYLKWDPCRVALFFFTLHTPPLGSFTPNSPLGLWAAPEASTFFFQLNWHLFPENIHLLALMFPPASPTAHLIPLPHGSSFSHTAALSISKDIGLSFRGSYSVGWTPQLLSPFLDNSSEFPQEASPYSLFILFISLTWVGNLLIAGNRNPIQIKVRLINK